MPDSYNPIQKKILRRALVLAGGFFVLALLMGSLRAGTNAENALSGIPNDAALALASNDQAVFDHLAERLNLLLPFPDLPPSKRVFVVLRNPLEAGFIVRVDGPQTLTELQTNDVSHDSLRGVAFAPLGDYLAALGSPQFIMRVQNAPRIPWWTRSKLTHALRKEPSAFLWAPSPETPWQVGTTDWINSDLRLTFHQTEFSMPFGGLEEVLTRAVIPRFPSTRLLRLPDGNVAREMRADPSALTWQNRGTKTTLLIDGVEIVSYERNIPPKCLSSSLEFQILFEGKKLLTLAENGDIFAVCF